MIRNFNRFGFRLSVHHAIPIQTGVTHSLTTGGKNNFENNFPSFPLSSSTASRLQRNIQSNNIAFKRFQSTPLLISKDNNEEEVEHENTNVAGGDHYDDESELKPKLSLWKRIRLWVLVGILLIAITINNVVFAIMAKPMKVRGIFFSL